MNGLRVIYPIVFSSLNIINLFLIYSSYPWCNILHTCTCMHADDTTLIYKNTQPKLNNVEDNANN